MDKEELIKILENYAREKNEKLSLIIVGAHALPFYGVESRYTRDIDAEVLQGDLYELKDFLESLGIEADLTENFSGWSVILMPSDYREKAITVYESPHLNIKVLDPYDFILSKLRRGTQSDIEDALKVAKNLKDFNPDRLKERIERTLKESPKDTQLLNFKKICQYFFSLLSEKKENRVRKRKMPGI